MIKKKQFEKMLDEYFAFRGWDLRTGIPTRKTLESLDLRDVADELEGRAYSLPKELTRANKSVLNKLGERNEGGW